MPTHSRFDRSPLFHRAAGFSLTEFVVAIALLAVLSSVLLASVVEERRSVLDIECRTILRQWGDAIWQYSLDNDGVYAVRTQWSTGEIISWPGVYSDYWTYFDLRDRSRKLRGCPLATFEEDWVIGQVDYALNWPSLDPSGGDRPPETAIPFGDTERARSDLLLLIDAEWEFNRSPYVVDGSQAGALRGAEAVYSLPQKSDEDDPEATDEPPQRRHRGEMNAVFADGHVRRVHWEPRSENDPDSIVAQWSRWTSLNVSD